MRKLILILLILVSAAAAQIPCSATGSTTNYGLNTLPTTVGRIGFAGSGLNYDQLLNANWSCIDNYLFGKVTGAACATTGLVTPNFGFNIPARGTQNWDALENANFTCLDTYLNGAIIAGACFTTGTVTPHFGLELPARNARLWNVPISTNFVCIDNYIKILYGSAPTCGPPGYQCSNTAQSNFGNITALFSSTAPTATTCLGACKGSTAYDTTVNTSGIDCYTRITDGTSSPSGASVDDTTGSGGDADKQSSINEDYLAINIGGSISIFGVTFDTAGCVKITNAVNPPAIRGIPYPFAFSQVTDNKFYSVASDNHTIKTGSISNVDTAIPLNTLTTVVDLLGTGVCPGINVVNPQSNSILIPANADAILTIAISSGGQNTADWVVSYNQNTQQCAVINFNTGSYWSYASCSPGTCNSSTPATGTLSTSGSSCWGSNGSTNNGIHDLTPSFDGGYVLVTVHGSWTQGACAGSGINNQFSVWQIGTATTHWCNSSPSDSLQGGCGTHHSMGFTTLLSPFSNGATQWNRRPISNVSNGFTAVGLRLNVQDSHQTWIHPNGDDTFAYWIGATDSTAAGSGCSNVNLCPAWPNNQVFGRDITGNNPSNPRFVNFGHTFACGPVGFNLCPDGIADGFGAGNAIGFLSSKGNYFCFSSSMLHAMGNDNTGFPRSDAFCISLIKG